MGVLQRPRQMLRPPRPQLTRQQPLFSSQQPLLSSQQPLLSPHPASTPRMTRTRPAKVVRRGIRGSYGAVYQNSMETTEVGETPLHHASSSSGSGKCFL